MLHRICPYPGLRTFSEQESLYFKGRERHIKNSIDLLNKNKFLMLTGASGDGKSSMTFAGILPQARGGIFSGQFPNWEVLDFKPQRNPIGELSKVISTAIKISAEETEQQLNLGYSSLVDLYKSSDLYFESKDTEGLDNDQIKHIKKKSRNLLIVVDQFEELFTNQENFDNGVPSDGAKLLINIIVETVKIAQIQNLPIYIICTMRADYFGDCSSFLQLPELIAQSQYFIPRLNRLEIKSIIEEPAILSGNKISTRLIERLLYDIEEGKDILPVLQHALFRIWKEYNEDNSQEMDLIHYAKVGGLSVDELDKASNEIFNLWLTNNPNKKEFISKPSLKNVLNAHADELYNARINSNKISDELEKEIIKKSFIAMTHIDGDKAVRNRVSIQEVNVLIGNPSITNDNIYEVIKLYSEEDHSLIRISQGNNSSKHILDISHEALIRNWDRLTDWLKKEEESIFILQDLYNQYKRWNDLGRPKDNLLPIGSFTFFQNWFNDYNPSKSWISNIIYDKNTDEEKSSLLESGIKDYLKASNKQIQTRKNYYKAAGVLIVFLLCFSLYNWRLAYHRELAAVDKAITFKANEIAMRAISLIGFNNTKAFELSKAGYKLRKTQLTKKSLLTALTSGPFYYQKINAHSAPLDDFIQNNEGIIVLTAIEPHLSFWSKEMKLIKKTEGYIRDGVYKAQFSEDGQYVYSLSDGYKKVCKWTKHGEFVKVIHDFSITGSFTVDNNGIVVYDLNGYFAKYNYEDKKVFEKNFNTEISSLVFDKAKNRYCIATNSNKIIVCSSTFKIEYLTFPDVINRLKINNKGELFCYYKGKNYLFRNKNGEYTKITIDELIVNLFTQDKINKLCVLTQNSVYLIDQNTLKTRKISGEHKEPIKYIAFDTVNHIFSTCSDEPFIVNWDTNGRAINKLFHGDIAYKIGYLKNGNLFSIHNSVGALIWDVGYKNFVLDGHDALVWDASFFGKDKYIIGNSYDNSYSLWSNTGKLLYKNIEDKRFTEIAVNKDDNMFSVFTSGGKLIICDSSGNKICQFHLNQQIYNVSFSDDNKYLGIACANNMAYIFDINKKEVITKLLGHTDFVKSIFIKNDKIVTSSFDGTLRFWDMQGKCLNTKTFHKKEIYYMTLSDDGSLIGAASIDGYATIWDWNGALINKFNFNNSVINLSFSKDRKYVGVCGLSPIATIFEIKSGKKVTELIGHSEMINTINFSKDNNILTASDDKTAILWNLKGEIINVYEGHERGVQSASFSKDETQIITASGDGTIRLWPTNLDNINFKELKSYPLENKELKSFGIQ